MVITDSTLQALARLEGSRDFAEVLAHFEAMLEETQTDLMQATDLLRIGNLQGTAKMLSEFLWRARNARHLMSGKKQSA